MYDSIVVGAGPSGGRISANLSSKGYKVLMIDLKSEIGIPNHCSGLVDERVVNIVGQDLVASGKGALEVVKHITGNRNIVRKRGGIIPIGPTELGLENIFLVGDAAGLNKATTGGGLYAALKSADSLSMAINKGSNILENYKKIWYNNFGKEILRDYEMRKILDKMEKYYKLWVPYVLTNVRGINAIGDVDYPSKILLYLMASSPLKINEIIKNFILLSNRNHNYSK